MLQKIVGIVPLSLLANSTLMNPCREAHISRNRAVQLPSKNQIPSTVPEPVNSSSLSWERQSLLELERHPNTNESDKLSLASQPTGNVRPEIVFFFKLLRWDQCVPQPLAGYSHMTSDIKRRQSIEESGCLITGGQESRCSKRW